MTMSKFVEPTKSKVAFARLNTGQPLLLGNFLSSSGSNTLSRLRLFFSYLSFRFRVSSERNMDMDARQVGIRGLRK